MAQDRGRHTIAQWLDLVQGGRGCPGGGGGQEAAAQWCGGSQGEGTDSSSVLELAQSGGRYEGCQPVCRATLRPARTALRPYGMRSCQLFGREVRECGWLLMLVCWRLWEAWECGEEGSGEGGAGAAAGGCVAVRGDAVPQAGEG